MYTVKKFPKGSVISQIETSKGTITTRATWTVYGVVDQSEKIVINTHPITGKFSQEIYSLKSTAQDVADWYNSKI